MPRDRSTTFHEPKERVTSIPMKPDRIVIRKLFGFYDHDIALHQDTRVTILVGINGTGKSTILRMIDKVSRGDFVSLSREPFHTIAIGFGDKYYEFEKTEDSIIARYKTSHTSKWSKHFSIVTNRAMKREEFESLLDRYRYLRNMVAHGRIPEREYGIIRMELRDLDRIIWDIRNNERMSGGDGQLRLSAWDETGLDTGSRELPPWLKSFTEGFHCHLISAQRLFKPVESESRTEHVRDAQFYEKGRKQSQYERQVLETISLYAGRLSDAIKEAQQNHSLKSLELNQRYLGSIFRGMEEPVKPKDSQIYLKEIENIGVLESKLMSAGLLKETGRTQLPDSFWNRSQEPIVASVIETYIDGTQEMFKVFEKLLDQTTMFSDVVNSHLTGKRIVISAERGFSVLLDDGLPLELDQLSSGEQHIIVLSYELIFETPENSLVLIDEPELSLHAAWQEDFVDDIRRMGEAQDLIYLLATHSLAIIDEEWEICHELRR